MNYTNDINKFDLEDYKVLFFDIFHKNNEIIMVMPAYNTNTTHINKIRVTHDNISLKLKTIISQLEKEAVIIVKYIFHSPNPFNDIRIFYDGVEKMFRLFNIKTTTNKFLSLTTLFKNDYKLINIFYNYYIKQGVEHFYLYYNGIPNNEIKSLCNKSNITLIPWDFNYYNDKKYPYLHHAQTGQIHHAIYKYGKELFDNMIFCDLDEYLYIPNFTLYSFIKTNNFNTYGFCNYWAKQLDYGQNGQNRQNGQNGQNEQNGQNGQNFQSDYFPNKFLIGEKHSYGNRSKCIHKLNTITTINIHKRKIDTNLKYINGMMFHFYNWSKPNRYKETTKLFEIKN